MEMSKKRYCFVCGEELVDPGPYFDPYDTCGKLKCDQEAHDIALEERAEAHRQLDEEMGW
jgi:hypothetical protein